MENQRVQDAEVHTLPVGRAYFADERGVVLRTTWHLDQGFLNMSIWQENVCVSTFQLRVEDSARLAAFLVEGLGQTATALLAASPGSPPRSLTRLPPPPAPAAPPGPATATGSLARSVRSAATVVATQLRQARSPRPR